jgi:hypothetical protein
MNMRDEDGLRHPILSVQQALISAYEKNCPLKPARTGKHGLKWTYEFKCLRKEVRRLFNKCRAVTTTKLVTQQRLSGDKGGKERLKGSKEDFL